MSSTEPPPTKRRRDSENAQSMTRSARFWFHDGSVILQTQDTLFRVHQSLLSVHSEVMKHCFAMPQPESEEKMDGCPVVHLGDTTKDVENMCALLYGLYHINDQAGDYAYIETMIRMGKKYEIAYFKDTALKHLREQFPRSFQECMQSIGKSSVVFRENKSVLLDVFNLAYENQIPSILPAAAMCIFFKFSLDEVLTGVQRPDMSLATLRPEALRICVVGRTKCMNSYFTGFLKKLDIEDDGLKSGYSLPIIGCRQRSECIKGLADVLWHVANLASDNRFSLLASGATPAGLSTDRLCNLCSAALHTKFKQNEAEWWERIPSLLDLPTWETIKDFDM